MEAGELSSGDSNEMGAFVGKASSLFQEALRYVSPKGLDDMWRYRSTARNIWVFPILNLIQLIK